MNMEPLVLAGAIFLAALAAGSIPLSRRVGEHTDLLRWMTGVAAGVLLASALLVAIPEGFELAQGDAGLAILAGFLMMLILEGMGIGHDIHEEHHDHTGHDHVHHPEGGYTLVIGLTVHAATDGLAIGAALASGSLHLTLGVFIAVLMHKLPAAFSLGVFSLHERGERNRAFRDLFVFSLATPLMILVTFYLLGDVSDSVVGLALLFAGGTFLYVATVDVLPDVHSSETGRAALAQVLTGAILMAALLYGLEASGLVAH